MNNLPLGAENDSSAPYNQKPTEFVDVETWASTSLSRPALLPVNDYEEYKSLFGDMRKDFRMCNLKEAFKHEHFTIKEILENLREAVDIINATGLDSHTKTLLNTLADEGDCWVENEYEVVLEGYGQH